MLDTCTIAVPRALPDAEWFTGLSKPMQDAVAIFTCILLQQYFADACKPSGLCPLKHDLIRQQIRAKALSQVKQLVIEQYGFIHTDNRYSPGKESIGYGFADPSCYTDVVAYELQTKAKRRAARSNCETQEAPKVTGWNDAELGRRVMAAMILWRLDWELATELWEAWVREYDVGLLRQLATTRQAETFYSGPFYACRPDSYSRVYTHFTSASSVFRPAMHYNGAPLISIDVSSCQPLLLTVVIRDQAQAGSDLDAWQQLCENGQLYAQLADSFSWSIQELKPALLSYICGPIRDAKAKPSKKTAANEAKLDQWKHVQALVAEMPHLFPSVDAGLRVIKQGSRHDSYKNASRLLQRREAGIVIDGATKSLLTSTPELPLLTLHDALLTSDEFVDQVEDALRIAFAEHGLSPNLKRESYASELV